MSPGAAVGGMVDYMCDLDDNAADIAGLLAAAPTATTFFVGHFGPVSREAVQALP